MKIVKILFLLLFVSYDSIQHGTAQQCPHRYKPARVENSKFKSVDKAIKRDRSQSGKEIYKNLSSDEKRMLRDDFNDYGGSYKRGCDAFEGRKGLYEVNHSPPKAAYQGTPYANIKQSDMPAALMEFGDHRKYHTTTDGELRDRVMKCTVIHSFMGEYGKRGRLIVFLDLIFDFVSFLNQTQPKKN